MHTASSRMLTFKPYPFLLTFENKIPSSAFGGVALRKAAKRTVLVHLSKIVDICELSCDASVFTVMHKVFRQCRGATLGNQISPVLAGLTVSIVSIEEEIYVRHLQEFFNSSKELFFCTRYVDNCLVIVSQKIIHDRLQHFLSNNFYQSPVELEHVTRNEAMKEFLGFDLQLDHHRLQLILRPGPGRHRTAAFHCARCLRDSRRATYPFRQKLCCSRVHLSVRSRLTVQ